MPTSDNFFGFHRHSVRTYTIFGQLLRFSPSFCPNLHHLRTTSSVFTVILSNLHHLRTTSSVFSVILSELTSSSDNFFSFLRHPVRTYTIFGQLLRFSPSFCPTYTIFGQLLRFSPSFCPNLHHLRTTSSVFTIILSELTPSSDNFFGFHHHLVRSLLKNNNLDISP
jgi:hypothetical protein